MCVDAESSLLRMLSQQEVRSLTPLLSFVARVASLSRWYAQFGEEKDGQVSKAFQGYLSFLL